MAVLHNKLNVEALKFLLVRRDKLGEEFRKTFINVIPLHKRESIMENPYACSDYYVWKKLKEATKMYFGRDNWYLFLKNSDTEKKLLSAICVGYNIEDDMSVTNDDICWLNGRLSRFNLLLDRYLEGDESIQTEILNNVAL